MKNLNDFVKDNLWGILSMIVFLGAFVAVTNIRITAIEVKAQENFNRIENIQKLIERVLILEEKDRGYTEDIKEIKQDIKEIKNLVR